MFYASFLMKMKNNIFYTEDDARCYIEKINGACIKGLSLRQLASIDLTINSGAKTVHELACDHAKFSKFLLEHNLVNSIYVSDISIGPVKRAEANLSAYINDDRLSLFQADGLDGHFINSSDLIVMTGLGAFTVIDILKKVRLEQVHVDEKGRTKVFLLIQVQSRELELFNVLKVLQLKLIDEYLIHESAFLYHAKLYEIDDFIGFLQRLADVPSPFEGDRISMNFYDFLAREKYNVRDFLFALWNYESLSYLDEFELKLIYRYCYKFVKYYSALTRGRFSQESKKYFEDNVQELENVISFLQARSRM